MKCQQANPCTPSLTGPSCYRVHGAVILQTTRWQQQTMHAAIRHHAIRRLDKVDHHQQFAQRGHQATPRVLLATQAHTCNSPWIIQHGDKLLASQSTTSCGRITPVINHLLTSLWAANQYPTAKEPLAFPCFRGVVPTSNCRFHALTLEGMTESTAGQRHLTPAWLPNTTDYCLDTFRPGPCYYSVTDSQW